MGTRSSHIHRTNPTPTHRSLFEPTASSFDHVISAHSHASGLVLLSVEVRLFLSFSIFSQVLIGKVVAGVLVEHHSTNGDERILGLWPRLGKVEGIPSEAFGLCESHHLNVEVPRGCITIRDRIVKITNGEIGVLSCHFVCFFGEEVLDSLLALEVKLAVDSFVVCVHHLERVASVSIHVPEALRCSSVTEEKAHLVGRLWS